MYPSLTNIVVAVLVTVVVPAIAKDYTVGDSSGWTQGVDYTTWASDKTFNVGDTLLFQYGFLHTVNEVGKGDYDSCSSSNSIKTYSDQNTKITLDKTGSRYFICGTAGHCSGGMKLAVNVGGASATTPGGSDSPPSTSTPGGSDSPPSTSTPGGSDSPSTPSSTPGNKGTPPGSTNTAVGSGFTKGNSFVVGVSLVAGVAALLS